MIEIKRISYAEADLEEVHRWIEHIVERVILDHLSCAETLKLELDVSKYLINSKYQEDDVV